MSSNAPKKLLVTSLLFGTCSYSDTLDNPGYDRGTCWEYQEERYLRWVTPTRRGFTPTDAMQMHASPGVVAGDLMDWVDSGVSSFIFTFDPDMGSDCRELAWASFEAVPERCRGVWELVMRTSGSLTIEHPSLPSVRGPGWVSVEDDGTAWSCLSVMDVRLTDEGDAVPWFDFVEEHMAPARPRQVSVYILARCDGSEGEVHIGYETAAEPDEFAGGQFFYFEN